VEAEQGKTWTREELILKHLPQVRLIATRIHLGLPASVSLDDLISAGTLGLIAAIDRYDAEQGTKLSTYAEYKIRGAILDSLRMLDWAPRQQRRRAKQIETAISFLEKMHRRVPSEEEIAQHLGLKLSEYHNWLAEANGLLLAGLESAAADGNGAGLLRFVSGSEEHWPSRLLERAELERVLKEALARLPEVERTVLSLYYVEELTLCEIGKVVELHDSRVSQLKSQAILRLRTHLRACWPQQGVPVKTRLKNQLRPRAVKLQSQEVVFEGDRATDASLVRTRKVNVSCR
jgi:RNA polymerase sigma factor for flagellar operon FliA